MRFERLLHLLLTPLVFACSDAKPRPQVIEPDAGDAADAAPVALVDAGPDAACSLPVSFGSSACHACVGQTCCARIAACEADEPCKTRTRCWVACFGQPDAGGCASVCDANHPDETGLWRDLWDCVYFKDPCGEHCAVTR